MDRRPRAAKAAMPAGLDSQRRSTAGKESTGGGLMGAGRARIRRKKTTNLIGPIHPTSSSSSSSSGLAPADSSDIGRTADELAALQPVAA